MRELNIESVVKKLELKGLKDNLALSRLIGSEMSLELEENIIALEEEISDLEYQGIKECEAQQKLDKIESLIKSTLLCTQNQATMCITNKEKEKEAYEELYEGLKDYELDYEGLDLNSIFELLLLNRLDITTKYPQLEFDSSSLIEAYSRAEKLNLSLSVYFVKDKIQESDILNTNSIKAKFFNTIKYNLLSIPSIILEDLYILRYKEMLDINKDNDYSKELLNALDNLEESIQKLSSSDSKDNDPDRANYWKAFHYLDDLIKLVQAEKEVDVDQFDDSTVDYKQINNLIDKVNKYGKLNIHLENNSFKGLFELNTLLDIKFKEFLEEFNALGIVL